MSTAHFRVLLFSLSLVFATGCVQLATPDGLTFTRFSPFFNGTIGTVEVTTPDFNAKITGYKNDAAEMLDASTKLINAAKGAP
jgi:hypothetical protein